MILIILLVNILIWTFIYFQQLGVIGLPGISINGAKGDLGESGYQGAAGRPGMIDKTFSYFNCYVTSQ